MAILGLRKTSFLASIFSGVLVTTFLFVALPLLSQLHVTHTTRGGGIRSVLLNNRKPPPPPSEERDKPREQKLVRKEIQKKTAPPQRTQPKFDIPKVGLSVKSIGTVAIKIGTVRDFKVSNSLFMSAFSLTEVDQPPRAIRTFPPQYPYIARRDNIQGRVILKFVVDTDGLAKEAEVEASEPKGVFDEAALKALERYRFKPAVKNGKPVMCIVRLPISFQLN